MMPAFCCKPGRDPVAFLPRERIRRRDAGIQPAAKPHAAPPPGLPFPHPAFCLCSGVICLARRFHGRTTGGDLKNIPGRSESFYEKKPFSWRILYSTWMITLFWEQEFSSQGHSPGLV